VDVHITDAEALAGRSPDDWTLYLEANGWEVFERQPGGTEWSNVSAPDDAIWLPKNARMRGYAARVGDILKVLANVERRSERDILFDVTHAAFDMQRIQLLPDGTPGTVRLSDGAESLDGIRKWVISGATSAALGDPYLVHPNRRPAEVQTFIRETRLAAPAEGSFVWHVVTPVGRHGQTTFPMPDESGGEAHLDFGRRATLALYRATLAAKGAAETVTAGEDAIAEVFAAQVAEGVSANLCEGLVEAASESVVPYVVNFGWSRTHRRPRSEPIRFEQDEIYVLSDAARELRSRVPQRDATARGYVVRLVRESKLRPGEITLAGVIEDDPEERMGHFWMELPDEDYARASDAHLSGKLVRATGDVQRVGNRRRLVNLRRFVVEVAGTSD
jgi:hypothetical protein